MFLEYLLDKNNVAQIPSVLGVADINPQAEGLRYADSLGIFTTQNYRDLYKIEGLKVLIELTDDATLWDVIRKNKPAEIELIDHIEIRSVWSALQMEGEKRRALEELHQKENVAPDTIAYFEEFADRLAKFIHKRNLRYQQIEKGLIENLDQIIQGSTIPTFVVNRDHIVTHWNKALEKLTNVRAREIVGTNKQWMPFWETARPSMADVILDQVSEEELQKLYGTKWRRSFLIEGAYEAEVFFPNLGEDGKWIWFTAAPIRSSDGTLNGAIETLWDKTEDKRAEQDRDRHTRLLTETAKALAESEKTMTQIIQGSTIPTFVIDEKHMVTHWNTALEKLTGFSADEMVGTRQQWKAFYKNDRATMADVILDQDSEAEIKKLYGSKWRKSGLIEDAYEAEDFFPRFGEKGTWLWFTAAPIKAPNGKIVGAIETLLDKTEDKNAEQERELHTRELSSLCSIYSSLNTAETLEEGINQAIQTVMEFLAADGLCIYLLENDGKYHLRYSSGFSKEACQRIPIVDESSIVHQVAQSGTFTLYEELPDIRSGEIRFLDEKKLASLVYIPISSKEKRTFGVIRIGSRKPKRFTQDQKDVLELIGNRIGVAIENAMLQEQVTKSEEKYRTLFNSDPHPIFILDSKDFKILDTNKRAYDTYGYSRQELLGVQFLQLGEETDEEIAEGLKSLVKDQSMLFTKKQHYRKGRQPFYVNINISSAKYGESDVIIASTTDITESVEKETQLIQASKMTTLGQMAAGIAHEINQPLNVIQVCADFFNKMITRGQDISNQDLQSMANDISKNVQRAAAIIQHMRRFARQSNVVRSKVNINDPIYDVFKVLGHQLRVHQVEVQLDLDQEIPPIMADHNRLEQVFINLVTNAVDAMDEKCSQPECQEAEKKLTIKSFIENGYVSVIVSDTGSGMSAEVMSKIFEPFFTTKDVGKGTGLGFSISYGIVKDYEGTIEIDSTVGEGTTFKLKFPYQRNAVDQ